MRNSIYSTCCWSLAGQIRLEKSKIKEKLCYSRLPSHWELWVRLDLKPLEQETQIYNRISSPVMQSWIKFIWSPVLHFFVLWGKAQWIDCPHPSRYRATSLTRWLNSVPAHCQNKEWCINLYNVPTTAYKPPGVRPALQRGHL